MGIIWLLGVIASILYRAFYAGVNSKTLFYRLLRYNERELAFDEGKLFGYIFVTLGISLFWPLSFPVLGVYMLGKRYQKEAN